MNHEYQDRVSLEMATRIAKGLPSRPDWLVLAQDNLDRWSRSNHDSPALIRCYEEWLMILQRPIEEICGILTQQNDEGQRLRQNSPFAGALTPQEVWDIKEQVRRDKRSA